MIATDAEVWARLRLVQGRSNAELWEFVSAHSQTLLTVGSAPGCSWVVQEMGVAPVHFTLHWDGASLSIADTHSAGKVRVDGAPIRSDWRPLSGRARIDFGNAAMVVETSGARVDQGSARDTAPLPPMSSQARRASQPPANAQVPGQPALKSTLLGVAPHAARGTPIVASVPTKRTVMESNAPIVATPPAAATPPASSPAPSDSSAPFVPKRPDSIRAPKPTLLGMAAQASPVTTNPPPATISASPAPKRVGGASLADGDQRTIQGFPSAGSVVQAPASITVTGSPSSTPPSHQIVEPQYLEREAAPQKAQPSQPSAPQPGTTLVLAQREESGRQPRQSPHDYGAPGLGASGLGAPGYGAPGFAAHPRNVPQTVVVLSPMGTQDQPEIRPRNSRYARRSVPPVKHVALAVIATVVTYAAWVYLLYHL